jgi:hypothetical protein
MASGLIVILAALIPFVLQVITAQMAKAASPATKLSDENIEIDKAIASNDAATVTLLLHNSLGKLQDTRDSGVK